MRIMYVLFLLICIPCFCFADNTEENKKNFGYSQDLKIVYDYGGGPVIPPGHYIEHSQFDFRTENSGCLMHFLRTDSKCSISPFITTDGGMTWEQGFNRGWVGSPKNSLDEFKYLGKNKFACMIGGYGWAETYFLHSDNLGFDWEADTVKNMYDIALAPNQNMLFLDNDTIFVQGTKKMYKTDFGGGWGSDMWYPYHPVLPNNLVPYLYFTIQKAMIDDTYFMVFATEDQKYYVARSSDRLRTWECFEIPRSQSFSFLDKDTWFIGCHNKYKPKPIISLLKITDSGSKIDTVFKYQKFIGDYLTHHQFGNNGEVLVVELTNQCLALSNDTGKSFEFILDNTDIDSTERLSVGWTKPNRLLLYSSRTNYIMMYNPNSSVETDIEKFNTKIYPNPAKANSKVYVSLENDKQRSAICKVFNLTGELIEESQEIAMPKGCHTLDFKTDGYITGTYFLVIESNGEIIAREKFVVE